MLKNTVGVTCGHPKSHRGITLIALVVTVIVLIILATITLRFVLGNNGIIGNANKAKNSTELADLKEQIQREFVRKERDVAQNRTEVTEADVREVLNKYGTVIEENGEIWGVGTPKGEIALEDVWGGKLPGYVSPVPIPDGFKASKKEGEDTVEKGFVIIGPDESEFVWVPVPYAVSSVNVVGKTEAEIKSAIDIEIATEKYPMAIRMEDGNYRGILYDFSLDTFVTPNKVKVVAKAYSSTGYREPDIVTSDASSANLVAAGMPAGKTQVEFKTQLQAEYNSLVASVIVNGGFYIGRYDSSLKGTRVQSKREETPSINDNWYNMYAKQKNYASQNGITTATSSMIWGSQWDQIMIWMREIQNEERGKPYIFDSTGMGWYSSNSGGVLKKTGTLPAAKVKNIYDMAGNAWEWTMEANNTTYRASRRRRTQ